MIILFWSLVIEAGSGNNYRSQYLVSCPSADNAFIMKSLPPHLPLCVSPLIAQGPVSPLDTAKPLISVYYHLNSWGSLQQAQ